MKENLKYTTKLAGSAALSFMKINVPGQILIGIFSAASILTILFQTIDSGTSGTHINGIGVLISFFIVRPVASILTLLSLIVSPILLFSLGNKYILYRLIHQLVNDKGENILFPILDKILNKLQAKQPALFLKGTDRIKLKLKMIQEIKDSNENKWFKKIILFALNKVHLNEVDFADEKLNFNDIIKKNMLSVLKKITEPSRSFFWIICVVQLLLFILIFFKFI